MNNENEDAKDRYQMIDRIEEERFLAGEVLYSNEFELNNDLIDIIAESNADENLENSSSVTDINDDYASSSIFNSKGTAEVDGDENDDDNY